MKQQCIKCDVTWPTYTTIDAYRNWLKVNSKHPNEPCINNKGERI
jgi:hypothetical protein